MSSKSLWVFLNLSTTKKISNEEGPPINSYHYALLDVALCELLLIFFSTLSLWDILLFVFNYAMSYFYGVLSSFVKVLCLLKRHQKGTKTVQGTKKGPKKAQKWVQIGTKYIAIKWYVLNRKVVRYFALCAIIMPSIFMGFSVALSRYFVY